MEKLYSDSYLQKTTNFINEIKVKSHDILDPKPGDHILEIGCGNGYDSIELAKRVSPNGKVVGIDIDKDLIQKAKQNASDIFCNNVEFILAEAERIPFKDNSFDYIRAERVFQHLKKPHEVIAEAYRLLKPGGKILLVETDWYGMNIYSGNRILEEKIIHTLLNNVLINGYASKNIISYFEEAGIKDIHVEAHPFLIQNYSIANELIKFDNIIKVGIASNKLTESDELEWNNKTSLLSKQNSFNLTTNMLLFWGLK